MLENIIECYFYKFLKEEYKIKKYENVFSFRDDMEMHMYCKRNNITIESHFLKGFEVKKDNKTIAKVEYIFGNLISKYNNRRIPKKYEINYL